MTDEEIQKFATERARNSIDICVSTIPAGEDEVACWIARLLGHAIAIGRLSATGDSPLTNEEYDVYRAAWFEVIVEGLMDNEIIRDDREKTEL